jgi:hypothetical protein
MKAQLDRWLLTMTEDERQQMDTGLFDSKRLLWIFSILSVALEHQIQVRRDKWSMSGDVGDISILKTAGHALNQMRKHLHILRVPNQRISQAARARSFFKVEETKKLPLKTETDTRARHNMVLKLNELQAKLDSQVTITTAETTQEMLNRECENQNQSIILPLIALLTAKTAFLSDQQCHVEPTIEPNNLHLQSMRSQKTSIVEYDLIDVVKELEKLICNGHIYDMIRSKESIVEDSMKKLDKCVMMLHVLYKEDDKVLQTI